HRFQERAHRPRHLRHPDRGRPDFHHQPRAPRQGTGHAGKVPAAPRSQGHRGLGGNRMFSVEIKPPKGQPQRVDCQIAACTIGKADDNLIVVRGWSVGKRHATIHQRREGFFVEDHGALGATEVNGKLIEKEYGPLKADDVIRIGDYNLKILGESSAPAAEAPAPVAPAAPKSASMAAPKPASPAPAAAPAPQPQPAPEPKHHEKAKALPKEVAAMREARRILHKKLI